MRLSLFVFAFLALAVFFAGSAFAQITTGSCDDGTQYGKCSANRPGEYCTGSLGNPSLGTLLTVCPCSNYPGWVQEGTGETASCVQAKCSDGTTSGKCVVGNEPKVCLGGSSYADNATKCGCPSGKKPSADGVFCEYIPCNDSGVSVPEGTCSPKKQKKCVSGQLVDKASECKCPVGLTVIGETCGVICDDGTKDGECSPTKPKECKNGYLIDNAAKCGCPDGLSAVGKQCTSSIVGSIGGSELLGGSGNESGTGQAGGASALSCCCLPTALIGILGGFAFFRKRK